jgi:hypothetical protein
MSSTDERISARIAGKLAAQNDQKSDENPHPKTSDLHLEWLRGWKWFTTLNTLPKSRITWNDPSCGMPPKGDPILIFGILDGEDSPATHEGFWCGWWSSIRPNTETHGGTLGIDHVTLWAEMPVPSPKS